MSNVEVGQRIRKRRQELGKTLQDVATSVGVQSSTIQRYESGKIDKMKRPVVEAIGAALCVNPTWLFGESENQDNVKMNKKRKELEIPVLSMFFGIIVRMYREQGGEHNLPHIRAEYSGQEIVVALNGTILEEEKDFPKNKLKMLEVWMDIHHEDLEANWRLLTNGEQFFCIDPLR